MLEDVVVVAAPVAAPRRGVLESVVSPEISSELNTSTTTYIFTDYLSTVSSSWEEQVGKGKSVSWPNGLAGKGNGGVAAIVKCRT